MTGFMVKNMNPSSVFHLNFVKFKLIYSVCSKPIDIM